MVNFNFYDWQALFKGLKIFMHQRCKVGVYNAYTYDSQPVFKNYKFSAFLKINKYKYSIVTMALI